jgi:MYXO-CTERM domain-containing protein
MAQNCRMQCPPSLAFVRRFWLLLPAVPLRALLVGLVLVSPRPAGATVYQPTGEPMPQPANPNEIGCCVTGRGFPADADTLAGLFMYHQIGGVAGGDIALDPIRDAHTTPGTFSPQCGLSGTIVLHGGGCKNALGWYNATMPATIPTTIYPIVPANLTLAPPNGISCVAGDFCPLATRMTTQPQYTWQDPLPDFAANIRTDPNWAGGLVGFALIGVPNTLCPQTKYSQADINDHSPAGGMTNGEPWVTTLIYQSQADPNGYYIAFEDQPTCTASWRGCNPGSQTQAVTPGNGNDGDFNDFVFYVSGIDCEGGGQACDTKMMGICANGTTQCANGGTMFVCNPNTPARTEVCNGLDDDCDGIIDNPDAPNLCPTGEVCNQGVCVFPCTNSEFPCNIPTVCDQTDQLCKEQACIGVTCDSGQVCHGGKCVGGCAGVTCPTGQVCRIGNCVDPCSGITCDGAQVCENGACVAPCSCRNCAADQACVATGPKAGICVDQGCDTQACDPPTSVCVKGACQDGCQGVVCPTGQSCAGGQCIVLDGGVVVGPQPDAGTVLTGAGGSSTPGTGSGGSAAPTTGTGGKSGAGGHGQEGGVTTCKCDAAEAPGAGGLALLLGALLVATRRRRAPRSALR